jgi:hypothetical protein
MSFRLDGKHVFHAKILLAGNEAYGAWCRAWQWASANGGDGVIPVLVAEQIAPDTVWQKLITIGLIESRADSAEHYVVQSLSAPAKPRKKPATRPVRALLTADELKPDERAVHEAIVQDATLVQICQDVPQLARDLVALGTENGRLVVNVIAEVRKAAIWNRDKAGTAQAWSTAGGNRGLRSWIERAKSRGYAPMQHPIPGSGVDASHAPKRVDMSTQPDLMPRPMRSARF